MCFILYPLHCPVVYSCKFACMCHAYGCGFPFLCCCLINVFLSLETNEIASYFDLGCNLYDIELHRWLVSGCSLTWKFVIGYQRLCTCILRFFCHLFWFSTSLYCRHPNWFTMLMSFSYNLWRILCRSYRVTGRKLEMYVLHLYSLNKKLVPTNLDFRLRKIHHPIYLRLYTKKVELCAPLCFVIQILKPVCKPL